MNEPQLRITHHPVAHRIAVIDDSPIALEAYQSLLQDEGHNVRTAETIESGIALVRDFKPDLLLLDYMLPDGSGADVVRGIREFNELLQVILVSGVRGEDSIRRLLAELDIQGFVCKDDGDFRLLLQVDAALKHNRVLQKLARQQQYLRSILDASPELSRLIPRPNLFEATLEHVIRLIRGHDSGTDTADGLIAVQEEDGIFVQAARGCFTDREYRKALPASLATLLADAMKREQLTARGGFAALPFHTRSGERGCMLVRAHSVPRDVEEPCRLYAAQVAQALENTRLYQRATEDHLTHLFNRDFGLKRLEALLTTATEELLPLSVMMLDVDHFKKLNDTHGHAAGDLALRQLATAMQNTCRPGDTAVRYGGEEFFAVFPDTTLDMAEALASRILDAIRGLKVVFDGKTILVTASAGVAAAAPGQTAEDLLHRADGALYHSKKAGRDRVTRAPGTAPIAASA